MTWGPLPVAGVRVFGPGGVAASAAIRCPTGRGRCGPGPHPGAVIGGALLRPGPLRPASTPSLAEAEAPTAQAKAGPALPA